MHSNDLEVIGFAPFNAETPEEHLAKPVTPTPNVYVRTNFGVPELDASRHRIRVESADGAGFEIGVAELRSMAQSSVTSTMECAGNDRLGLRPLPRGEPWQSGALSTISWRGVPLRALLERVSIRPDAVEVLVEGADSGMRVDAEEPVRFARALPVSEALSPDTLLALEMNGAPLTPAHGAPARLVVPGWYGMANVKWVTRVRVLAAPFTGYFQTRRYIYRKGTGIEPVGRMRVKSIVVAPSEGSSHAAGPIRVWGWAWSGAGAVSRVELAVGDGEWRDARVEPQASPYAWARWEAVVRLDRPGRYVLRSRATDTTGAAQPDLPEWNDLGYGNNAVRQVVIEVR